jgi:diaminopimelate decarboxylase
MISGDKAEPIRKLPFSGAEIAAQARRHATPFYVYDESGIRSAARRLIDGFSWNRGFREYFAVKATPNPAILRILKDEGCGADCSSLPELLLAESAGIVGENIMFSSNDTPAEEFRKARELGAIINIDDAGHIPFMARQAGIPQLVSCRLNAGNRAGGNSLMGSRGDSKFGMREDQLFDAYQLLRDLGARRFGLHAMLVSNELRAEKLAGIAETLFGLAADIRRRNGIEFEFINLGGGIGIPYEPHEGAFDITAFSSAVRQLFEHHVARNGMGSLRIFMECGRYITGPSGFLVSRVLHVKKAHKTFVGLDASMANLMRPGMYQAHHHISVIGKEDIPCTMTCDVVGSLCENNDKFARDRNLPAVEPGDIVVIHDTGAHGHAMGFNYNGKLRSAELLFERTGEFRMIRRAETVEDYFATLDLNNDRYATSWKAPSAA